MKAKSFHINKMRHRLLFFQNIYRAERRECSDVKKMALSELKASLSFLVTERTKRRKSVATDLEAVLRAFSVSLFCGEKRERASP